MYQFDLWHAVRWQTDTRYYTAEILQDIFGAWVLRLSWGGLRNRMGNYRESVFSCHAEALEAIKDVYNRRRKRGYNLI